MIKLDVIATGLKFPEGPVAMADGSVILTEIANGEITRIAPDGSKSRVARTGGGPNGLALGPDGRLYCANNGGFAYVEHMGSLMPVGMRDDYSGGRIERVDIETGRVEVLYQSGDFGCVLRGPNDIVFDAHGGFWFTDHGKIDYQSRQQDVVGIFYGKADGSHLEEVIFPSNHPNGIGLSPDYNRLYVAETFTCMLTEYRVTGPGQITPDHGGSVPGRMLYRPAGYKFFDSLAVEASGNICVATVGESGISVVSPEGALVDFVPTDELFTTNICFGGPDMMDAWITLSGTGRLAKARWRRPGLKLAHQA